MENREYESITRRLERLEVEGRRWKVLAGASLAALCLLLFVGAGGREMADEIQVRKIVIVDDVGETRIALRTKDDGSPMLRLYDEGKKGRLSLNVGANGEPGMWLYDEDGSVRFGVKVKGDGTPQLQFYNEEGNITWEAKR